MEGPGWGSGGGPRAGLSRAWLGLHVVCSFSWVRAHPGLWRHLKLSLCLMQRRLSGLGASLTRPLGPQLSPPRPLPSPDPNPLWSHQCIVSSTQPNSLPRPVAESRLVVIREK